MGWKFAWQRPICIYVGGCYIQNREGHRHVARVKDAAIEKHYAVGVAVSYRTRTLLSENIPSPYVAA